MEQKKESDSDYLRYEPMRRLKRSIDESSLAYTVMLIAGESRSMISQDDIQRAMVQQNHDVEKAVEQLFKGLLLKMQRYM